MTKTLSQKYLPEFVYGATDGTVTTFAIIAAVSGAALSPAVVLILGYASVLADGFSMAASNYLSEKSESDVRGHEEIKKPIKTAMVTFMSFVIVGSIPMLPFLVFLNNQEANPFMISVIATAVAFLIIGYVRGRVVGKSGVLFALETLAIGGVAALIAYFSGAFIESLL